MIRRLIILSLIVGCEEETTEPEDKAACLWETFNEKYNPPFTTFNYNYYCYNEFLKENDCIEKHEQIKDMNDFPKLIKFGGDCTEDFSSDYPIKNNEISLECNEIKKNWHHFYHGDTYWYGDHNCEEICEEYIKQDWGDCTICMGYNTSGECIQ